MLEPGRLPPDWGWRAAFGIGAVLGLAILMLRRWVPESPRWLMLHARLAECETVIAGIELRVRAAGGGARLAARSGPDPACRPVAHAGDADDPGDPARLPAPRGSGRWR